MVFCTQKVENVKSKTRKETHPEVDLSTLAVRYGALVEYLKEYHCDVLEKAHKNEWFEGTNGLLPCEPFRARPEEQRLERQ